MSTPHTPGPWILCRPIGPAMAFPVETDATAIAVVHGGCAGEANARLIAAAPDLLTLARQYASECAACDGAGLVTIHNYDGNGSDADDQPCGDCADIRAVITKAVSA